MYPEEMTGEMPVRLEEMLVARELRARRQASMIARIDDGCLVCLVMNIPGPYKTFPIARELFHEGIRIFEGRLTEAGMAILEKEERLLITGDECY